MFKRVNGNQDDFDKAYFVIQILFYFLFNRTKQYRTIKRITFFVNINIVYIRYGLVKISKNVEFVL